MTSKSEPARLILTIVQEPYTVTVYPGTMIRNNTKTHQISGCFRSSLVFCSSVFFLETLNLDVRGVEKESSLSKVLVAQVT